MSRDSEKDSSGTDPENVTKFLSEIRTGAENGVEKGVDQILSLVYNELHKLAQNHLRRERQSHTIQATALVHEAYLRLVLERERNWENRVHFFSLASMAMRRILVNYARDRKAIKRGGDAQRITMTGAVAVYEDRAEDIVALNEALNRLAEQDPDKARIVELRFFAGLTCEEVATLLETSTRTIERAWRFAKAWLRKELDPNQSQP